MSKKGEQPAVGRLTRGSPKRYEELVPTTTASRTVRVDYWFVSRPSSENLRTDDIRQALNNGCDEAGLPMGWRYADDEAIPTPDRPVEAVVPVDELPLGEEVPGPRLSRNGKSFFCRSCATVLERRSRTADPGTFCDECRTAWNQRRMRVANRRSRGQVSVPLEVVAQLQSFADDIHEAVGDAVMQYRRLKVTDGSPIDRLMRTAKDMSALVEDLNRQVRTGARNIGG